MSSTLSKSKPATLSGGAKVALKVTEAPKVKVESKVEDKVEVKPFVAPSLVEQLALQRKIRSNG